MAKQILNTIKNWFRTGLKPTQAQFWDTWDSFWHKDDTIPTSSIENLDKRFDQKADAEAFTAHLTDPYAHNIQNKVDKQEGKDLSSNDFSTPEKQKLAALKDYTADINRLQDLIEREDPILISGQQVYRINWTEEFQQKYGTVARSSAQVKVPETQVWKPVSDYRMVYNPDGSTESIEWDLDGLDTKIFIN
ncbi:hypothetical protein TH53_13555 [Pedobacter lusitanus]|uniref:Uncharacterized protein n=1 Tax=Pedobacter lusitanus TaxID=1503925 RepID=A0A0D0GQ69_9SPHI|nr:hypothetical protein [Pedobacter lusitanus]KIO76696.1 hypothetical protein TH53_13555 [Pedobacter lusitanus]